MIWSRRNESRYKGDCNDEYMKKTRGRFQRYTATVQYLKKRSIANVTFSQVSQTNFRESPATKWSSQPFAVLATTCCNQQQLVVLATTCGFSNNSLYQQPHVSLIPRVVANSQFYIFVFSKDFLFKINVNLPLSL